MDMKLLVDINLKLSMDKGKKKFINKDVWTCRLTLDVNKLVDKNMTLSMDKGKKKLIDMDVNSSIDRAKNLSMDKGKIFSTDKNSYKTLTECLFGLLHRALYAGICSPTSLISPTFQRFRFYCTKLLFFKINNEIYDGSDRGKTQLQCR